MSGRKPKSELSLSRRAFMANMGAMGALLPSTQDPLRQLVSSLCEGLINQADAAAVKERGDPTRYLFVGFAFAPSRWTWDNILGVPGGDGTAASANFKQNLDHIVTGFDAAGRPAYLGHDVNVRGATMRFPHLWGQELPTSDGGRRAMVELLNNFVVLRGIAAPSDGHEENIFKQLRPSQAAESIQGSHASAAHSLIPLVGLSRDPSGDFIASFRSKKGLGQFVTNPSGAVNPLVDILSAFVRDPTRTPSQFNASRARLESVMNEALKSLGEYSRSGRRGADALYANAGSAEKLFKRQFSNLADRWVELQGRYAGLVRRSMEPIPGVTDRPIPISAYPNQANDGGMNPRNRLSYSEHAGKSIKIDSFGVTDFRQMLGPDSKPTFLAEIFAVAEFLFEQDLTRTVMGVVPSQFEFNTTVPVVTPNDANDVRTQNGVRVGTPRHFHFDQHWTGGVAAAVVTSHMNMALASCLHEFRSAMKRLKVWDNTVVQIGSDFGRSPKATSLEGSDHGFRGHQLTFLTGLTSTPLVTGDVVRESRDNRGTWGEAAPVRFEGSVAPLNLGHAISTVAEILGVESPTSNFKSALRLDRSGRDLVSGLGAPKNV